MIRREILKSIATTGIGGATIVGGASATSLENFEAKTSPTHQTTHKYIISKIKSNKESREILRVLREKGFHPRFRDTDSFKIEDDRDLSRAAIVPTTRRDRDKPRQAFLLWQEEESGSISPVANVLNTDEKTETTYWIEDEDLVSEEMYYGSQSSKNGDISTAGSNEPTQGGGNSCIGVEEFCTDWNYPCVGKIAIRLGICGVPVP